VPTESEFIDFMNEFRNRVTDSSIKGYIIEAGLRTGIPRERICDMIEEIKQVLKDMGPEEAAKIYEKF
jgi:hypothetical protein